MVAVLVENKADVNDRNNDGKTPCDLVPEKGKNNMKISSIIEWFLIILHIFRA